MAETSFPALTSAQKSGYTKHEGQVCLSTNIDQVATSLVHKFVPYITLTIYSLGKDPDQMHSYTYETNA